MKSINIIFLDACPEGAISHPYKNRCFKVMNQPQTWKDADQTCKDMDGLLAVIPNKLSKQAVWTEISEQYVKSIR